MVDLYFTLADGFFWLVRTTDLVLFQTRLKCKHKKYLNWIRKAPPKEGKGLLLNLYRFWDKPIDKGELLMMKLFKNVC